MKNLLTFLAVILCSFGAFGQGAQYRPTPFANGFVQTVTSTGTAQTYLGIGSATNNALLNATNQVFTGTNAFNTNLIFGSSTLQTQLDSKPTVALTNVARLDQSQTWTGTPTFPASVFLTNAIGLRFLGATNGYFTNIAVGSNLTNAGDYANCTQVGIIRCPALIGTRSMVYCSLGWDRSNAVASAVQLALFVGSATNSIGYSPFGGTSAARGLSAATPIFINAGSFTNQYGTLFTGFSYGYLPLVDTSQPWDLYVGLFTTTGSTNFNLFSFNVFSQEIP